MLPIFTPVSQFVAWGEALTRRANAPFAKSSVWFSLVEARRDRSSDFMAAILVGENDETAAILRKRNIPREKNSPLVKSSSFYLGQLIFKVLYFVTIQKIALVGTLSKLRFPSRNQYGRWPRDWHEKRFSLISGNITRVTSVISVLDCDQAFRVPQAHDR